MTAITQTTGPEQQEPPAWYEKIQKPYNARTASQFLLHFNVRDKVFRPDWPARAAEDKRPLLRVGEYLCDYWHSRGVFQLILTYSLTGGIALYQGGQPKLSDGRNLNSYSPASENLYTDVAEHATQNPDLLEQFAQPSRSNIANAREPRYAFTFLNRLLSRSFGLKQDDKGATPKMLRIALIIDYLEHLAPAAQNVTSDLIEIGELLTRWAIDDTIRDNRHLIILLAEDINQINPALSTTGAGTERIELPRPEREERLAFLQWQCASQRLTGDENELKRLARATAGFNYADLEDMSRYAVKHGGPNATISDEMVREHKRDVIRAESRELLEFVQTDPDNPVGWGHVGGLANVVDSLKTVAEWLRDEEKATRLAPKGMLFVGPPGTGKSLVAQALAHESGINMVKLRNIQNAYVGQSERNMSRVLDIVRSFAPVIVFIDEIDQAYGQRSTGELDAGVSARLFGQLLEFMGDNRHRGKVLWIAASNRPDYIDDALISRFDRIIPFMLPNEAGRSHILSQAMPKIARFEWRDGPEPESWPAESKEEWQATLSGTDKFSGRLIEQVIRRALEFTPEPAKVERVQLSPAHVLRALEIFKPNYNEDMYTLQTYLALQVTNFTDYLPDVKNLGPEVIRDSKLSSKALAQQIGELRARLGIR